MAATMQIHEMSKTYQYRKVMKPMLERKRRARINKCLDELKDLMVATLESEGEHVTRLEKADILELTVQHLQKLRQKRKLGLENYFQQTNTTLSQAEGFRSGFIYAANEISRNLANLPGINITFGTKLMTHLGKRLNQLQSTTTATTTTSATISPIESSTTALISKTQIPLNTANLKIPIPIHHPITINCGGQIQNMQTTTTPSSLSPTNSSIRNNILYGSYSVQLSPVSNYSQSPKSNIHCDSITTKSENINCINGNKIQQESEDNVWRPW